MKLLRAMACAIFIFTVVGCSGSKRTIRIPESVVPNPKNKKAGDQKPSQGYVIKMSDGKRTHQIEIHDEDLAEGSVMHVVQLGDEKDGNGIAQTEADRDIIEAKKAQGEATPKTEPGKAASARSYLGTLARVNTLFKKKQYEMALIELTPLEREYPDDERVLEMKGTLYWKLRRPRQAREAWERVLALNPNNTVVAQALEQLAQDGE